MGVISSLRQRLFPTPADFVAAEKKRHPPSADDRAEWLLHQMIPFLPEDAKALFRPGKDNKAVVGELGISYPDAYVVTLSKGRYAILIHTGVEQFFRDICKAAFTNSNIGRSENDLSSRGAGIELTTLRQPSQRAGGRICPLSTSSFETSWIPTKAALRCDTRSHPSNQTRPA
jgi:hypothetical protein